MTISSFDAFTSSPRRVSKYTSYFSAYDFLLKNTIFGATKGGAITLVEIGVLDGGGLHMWKALLPPDSRIIGIDLNPQAKKYEAEGFEIYIGSQSDPGFWREFFDTVGMVDIVVDDGGHMYKQQITTCEHVIKQIRDGGVMIVEDVHTSYMKGFGKQSNSFCLWVFDKIHQINRRSPRVNQDSNDNLIWCVLCFESIVAFMIDRTRAGEPVTQIDNIPHNPNTGLSDYRELDTFIREPVPELSRLIKKLKNVIAVLTSKG